MADVVELLYTRKVLQSQTMLIDYFKYITPLWFANIFIFFLIPRTLWATKPSMLGYWLIREARPGGFGSTHNKVLVLQVMRYEILDFLRIIFSILIGVLILNYKRLLTSLIYMINLITFIQQPFFLLYFFYEIFSNFTF